jgi:hypothetical protein
MRVVAAAAALILLGTAIAVWWRSRDEPVRSERPIPVRVGCPSQARAWMGMGVELPVRIDARKLVGLPLEQARVAAERRGCYVRIVRLDGKPHELFLDARRLRINVIVERGVVTGIRNVG